MTRRPRPRWPTVRRRRSPSRRRSFVRFELAYATEAAPESLYYRGYESEKTFGLAGLKIAEGEGTMKKILVVLLAAAVVLTAAACSKKKEGTSETAEPTEAQEAARVESVEEGSEAAPAAESRASLPEDGEWQDAFKFVRDAIRTEPSRYPLKTPDGVEWSRSANPLEKALFLARLLQEKGMTVEIAEGELDDAAARSLLGAIFPAAKAPSYKSGTPISDPAEDRRLVAAVKRHFWVRIEEGDGWIDLDPSFPSAEPGKAFAELAESHDPADEALGVKVSLSVSRREISGGTAESVLSWDGTLAEVVNKPVSLTVMTEYRGGEAEAKEKEEEAGGGVGGLFGGLSGGTSAKKKPAGAAEAYLKVSLMAGEESLAEGEAAGAEGAEILLNLGVKFESLGEVVSNPGSVFFKAVVGRSRCSSLPKACPPDHRGQDPGRGLEGRRPSRLRGRRPERCQGRGRRDPGRPQGEKGHGQDPVVGRRARGEAGPRPRPPREHDLRLDLGRPDRKGRRRPVGGQLVRRAARHHHVLRRQRQGDRDDDRPETGPGRVGGPSRPGLGHEPGLPVRTGGHGIDPRGQVIGPPHRQAGPDHGLHHGRGRPQEHPHPDVLFP